MAFRSDIIAGRAVIQVSIQDTLDRQLRTMKSKLFAFSNSINKIGQDLLVAGSIGTFGAIFPVKQFVDFQDTMLFVQTKLKDTGVDVVKLEAYIRNLGRTTSFTSRQVAEGAAVLAQAGVGKGIQDLLLPSLDLARGARIEIDAAARILTNAVTAFGLGFDKAGKIASQITTASRLGTLDVVLLGESLKEVSGTLRNLGVPFQDSIALITALSNVSLRGTKAGTSLNTALTQLTSKFEELTALGIKIDPKVDFANPRELFQKISDGLAELTPTEQVAELQSIFNIRGARAIAGINVQGLEKLDGLVKQIKASTDEARESAVLMDSQLGGAFRRAASAFDELNISIGATTEGPLTKLSIIFKDIFTNLSTLATLYPVTTQWLVALPVISLAAGVGLIGLSVAASRLAIFITPLVALNSLLFESLKKLGSLAFVPIANGFRLIYQQPVAKVSAAIARENNAVVKAQTRLQRELGRKKLNPGNLTQAITAVNKAQASRSLLTRPVDQIFIQLIGSITNAGSKIRRVISNILSATRRVFTGQSIFKSLDLIIKGTLSASRAAFSVVRGLFVGLRGITRFVFSLSGIITILELLIIAGPKIRPIKAILDGIGAAFGAAFGTISQTIKDTLPLVRALFEGLRKLAFVNPQQGIAQIKAAVISIGEVLGAGFALAWERFKFEAEKGINFVKLAFAGIFATFSAVGEIIGAAASTLFGTRNSDPKEPYEFGEGPINALLAIFDGIFVFLEGLGVAVVKAADIIRTALSALFDVTLNIYKLLAGSWLGTDEDRQRANDLSGGAFAIQAAIDQRKAEIARLNANRPFANQLPEELQMFNPLKQSQDKRNELIDAKINKYLAEIANLEISLGMAGGSPGNPVENIISDMSAALRKLRESIQEAAVGIEVDRARAQQKYDTAILNSVNRLFEGSTGINLQGFFKSILGEEGGEPTRLPTYRTIARNLGGELLNFNTIGVAISDGISAGIGRIKDFFTPDPDVEAKAKAAELAKKMSPTDDILKTVTGFARDAQGQKLQIVPNKVQEKIERAVNNIDKGVDAMNDELAKFNRNAQPLVFTA